MSGTELFYLCFHVQFLEVDIKPILQMRHVRPEEVKRDLLII